MSIKTPPIQDVPKLTLHVPVGRDYGFLLLQTKTVYDSLLSDKQSKLIDDIVQQKQEYDAKCNMFAQESHDKALEFAVRAQAHLLKLQEDANRELTVLQEDYQGKLNAMQHQLETAWKNEAPAAGGSVQAPVVPPHK